MKELLKPGWNIVYGLTESHRNQLTSQLEKELPNYKNTIINMFKKDKKIGPFHVKVNKTVKEIAKSELTSSEFDMFMDYAEELWMTYFTSRHPVRYLTDNMLREFSLIVEVVRNKKGLIISDQHYSFNTIIQICLWLKEISQFKQDNGTIVWLTSISKKELVEYMNLKSFHNDNDVHYIEYHNQNYIEQTNSNILDSFNITDFFIENIENYRVLDFSEVLVTLLHGKITAGDVFLCERTKKRYRVTSTNTKYEHYEGIGGDYVHYVCFSYNDCQDLMQGDYLICVK